MNAFVDHRTWLEFSKNAIAGVLWLDKTICMMDVAIAHVRMMTLIGSYITANLNQVLPSHQ